MATYKDSGVDIDAGDRAVGQEHTRRLVMRGVGDGAEARRVVVPD